MKITGSGKRYRGGRMSFLAHSPVRENAHKKIVSEKKELSKTFQGPKEFRRTAARLQRSKYSLRLFVPE